MADTQTSADLRRFIGVDLGGTKILGVVVDPQTGEVSARRKAPTPKDEPELTAQAIGDVVAELIHEVGQPVAIGVGVPGLVDHDGVLHYGPNVQGVLNLDIAGELRARFGVDVIAESDAANAAVAEHRLGAARGHDHAVIITQGTGIGCGLIVGGRLLRGANGFAGEPGHMLVDADGHTCACGRTGCWETVSSGAGLANISLQLVAEGRAARIVELAGGEPAHVRGEHVSQAMAEGDSDAFVVFDRFATWVARGLGSLISILDPSIVVLGGGLSLTNENFLDAVRERVMANSMGGTHRPIVPVEPAQLGEEAGAIGGAINAFDRFVGGANS